MPPKLSGRMVDVVREAQAMGFAYEITNGGHLRFTLKDPPAIVIAPKTASDHRALANMRADLRRAANPDHPFGKRVNHERR